MAAAAILREAPDKPDWWELRSPYVEGFVKEMQAIPMELKEWQGVGTPGGSRWLIHESALDKVAAWAERYYDLEVVD